MRMKKGPNKIYGQLKDKSYNNSSNFYKRLKNDNEDIIQSLISSLISNHDPSRYYLINFLKKITTETTEKVSRDEEEVKAANQLMQMIKATLEEYQQQIPEQEQQKYKEIIAFNLDAIDQKEKNKEWRLNFTKIQYLIGFDFLSLIFKQNRRFTKQTGVDTWIISKQQMGKYLGLSQDEVRSIYEYYLTVEDYLHYNYFHKLQDLLIILTLIKVRVRLAALTNSSYQKVIVSLENEKKRREKEALEKKQNWSESWPFDKYRFSELVMIYKERDRMIFPSNAQPYIVRLLKELSLATDQHEIKRMIFKIRKMYRIRLQFIFQLVDIVVNRQEKDLSQYFQKEKYDLSHLCQLIKPLFVKYDTYQEAFDSTGITKDYELKFYPGHTMPKGPKSVLACISLTFIKSWKANLSVVAANINLLKNIRNIVVITKFELSYNFFAKHAHKQQRKDDEKLTYILATQRKSILFYSLSSGQALQREIWKNLSGQIQKNKYIQKPFIIVFATRDLVSNTVQYDEALGFIRLMSQFYQSCVFISNFNNTCSFNFSLHSVLLAYLSQEFKRKDPECSFLSFLQINILKVFKIFLCQYNQSES